MNKASETSSFGGSPGLAWSCVILTSSLLAVFPVFAYFGYSRSGFSGLASAAVAGTVCWLSGLVALLFIGLFRGGQAVVSATLMGMFFRTGLPLAVGLFLTQQGGELAQAGVFGMIMGYYLVTLVVDTLLSVRLVGLGQGSFSKAS